MGLTTNGDLAQLTAIGLCGASTDGDARRLLMVATAASPGQAGASTPTTTAVGGHYNYPRSRDARHNWHKSIVRMFSSNPASSASAAALAGQVFKLHVCFIISCVRSHTHKSKEIYGG